MNGRKTERIPPILPLFYWEKAKMDKGFWDLIDGKEKTKKKE